ncbi:hypothetical protein SAY87_024563 [Trapa incisa]|uniref:Pentatricopeptide repeat-containing protein n=1 Tax=Trapa incisa TaxID=236973 RepID=A0AAN7G9K2_9MYRT|nr:hypothetical protein SAY87_024563 [Trapa incisa]
MVMQAISTPSPLSVHHLHSFRTENNDRRNSCHLSKVKTLKKAPFHIPRGSPRKKTKKFAEEDAFPSSLPLHTRNPGAIYKDIQRFARLNKLKEALTILDYLDQQGIPVNITTFSSLLAACVRLKSLEEGKHIHTHIRINGLENNEFLNTKLVHMYMSCGSVEDAKRVLGLCSSKTIYPYNAMMRGNVISGRRRYVDAITAFSEVRELGIECDEYTFTCMIKSFAGASALRQGLKTHALLIKNGWIESSMLRTGLIDMYFKCGKVKLARLVFEEFDDKDIVVWGAMLAGFAHNRLQWQALDYTRRMMSEGLSPNSVILTTVFPVLGILQAEKLGKELHAYVVKTKSYSRQLSIQSALIDMYCKCGDMAYGRQVFYQSMERNAISWTALMSGYISNGRPDQALRSIVWMQQEGFKPDVVSIATILPVCSKLRALKHGKELHAYAIKNEFFPNVSLTTSLMVMYSKCGVFDYTFSLFEGMPKRNAISWTAMLDSLQESGNLCEALEMFRSFHLSKHRPDSVAVARILNVCTELKVLKLGKEVHAHVLKRKFEGVPFVSAEMIKMYGCCGATACARLVFDSVPVKGSLTWTAIIEAHGASGLYREAVNLFDQMIIKGFTPNLCTFKTIISICEQAGFADDAKRIYKSLPLEHKIGATHRTYNSVSKDKTSRARMDCLKNSGKVEPMSLNIGSC